MKNKATKILISVITSILSLCAIPQLEVKAPKKFFPKRDSVQAKTKPNPEEQSSLREQEEKVINVTKNKLKDKRKVDEQLKEQQRQEKIAQKKAKELKRQQERKKKIMKARAPINIEELIKVKCKKYNVPYLLALGISRLETGWFKSDAFVNYNNPGGLCYNGKVMYFNSLEEGVEAFIKNLLDNYINIGLTTPETIGPKYCPPNADYWANNVERLMYN